MSIFENVHDTERIWNRLIGLTVTSALFTIAVIGLTFAALPIMWAFVATAWYVSALSAFLVRWSAEATSRIIGVTATAQINDFLKEKNL